MTQTSSDNTGNLHVLSSTDPSGRNRWSAQRWRRFWTTFTFFPFVVLPVVLAIVYYAAYASDRYAVEIKFSVRSPAGGVPTDLMGLVSGVSNSGSTTVDSYIVSDFIQSRDLVDKLEQRIDLRDMFDTDKADLLTRFDSSGSKEDLVDYLQGMITVYYDTSSQIITVETQAFTPGDSQLLASEILDLSGNLVNDISERARLDTVRSAEAEVARNEELLREHRASMALFREQEQDIDPTRSAEAQQVLLGGLERDLSESRTKLSTLLEFLREDSPQVKFLDSQIAALEAQVEVQRARLGSGETITPGAESLTARLGAYEELAVDLEFLQRSYISSLVSLEAARLEADRQQRYLASFVLPSLPESAQYPKRVQNVFIVLALSVMAWGIAVMAVYVVREHLP